MDNKALVLDLVEWVAKLPRPYAEVMDAWRAPAGRALVRSERRAYRTQLRAVRRTTATAAPPIPRKEADDRSADSVSMTAEE